ncbi:MAG TPA: hypothetical protein VH115_02030 [Solirubrobacteraceae bacterium]|nr:hypothetical protein [Solirubrobacteraceae bacterium]
MPPLATPPAPRRGGHALATVALTLLVCSSAIANLATNGLAYSSASARVIQRQPAPGACHARGSGLYSRPDPRCTPGALNPVVTQSTVGATICRPGWTRTVRPDVSITEPEKLASMRAYGERASPSRFEYDHLVPLELGGAPNDARNLWPEPDYAGSMGFYRNPKDELENALKRMVCDGRVSLSAAQRAIAGDWVSAYLKDR